MSSSKIEVVQIERDYIWNSTPFYISCILAIIHLSVIINDRDVTSNWFTFAVVSVLIHTYFLSYYFLNLFSSLYERGSWDQYLLNGFIICGWSIALYVPYVFIYIHYYSEKILQFQSIQDAAITLLSLTILLMLCTFALIRYFTSRRRLYNSHLKKFHCKPSSEQHRSFIPFKYLDDKQTWMEDATSQLCFARDLLPTEKDNKPKYITESNEKEITDESSLKWGEKLFLSESMRHILDENKSIVKNISEKEKENDDLT